MKLHNFTHSTTIIFVALFFTACEKKSDAEFEKLKTQAENGSIVLQIEVGRRYENGIGVTKNINEAAKWYKKTKVVLSSSSNQLTEDFKELIIRAEYDWDYESQYLVGLCYEDEGFGFNKPKPNIEEAIKWYKKSANNGNGDTRAIIRLSQYLDYEEMKSILKNANTFRNDSNIQVLLSEYYIYQDNIYPRKLNRDITKIFYGVELLEKSAIQGNPRALITLETLHRGRILDSDYYTDERKAWMYERLAEEQKLSSGLIFYESEFYFSVKPISNNVLNYLAIISDCRADALLGDKTSQYKLANYYAYGHGVEKNIDDSLRWYKESANQGYALALFALGNRYYDGVGLIRDEVEAYAYWNIAGATIPKAREYIFILEKKITPEVRVAGQKRSKELQKEIEAKIAAKGEKK
jgi:uncharacterized protein